MSVQLMKFFNFTENDLDYNRSGMLSPEQQARVKAPAEICASGGSVPADHRGRVDRDLRAVRQSCNGLGFDGGRWGSVWPAGRGSGVPRRATSTEIHIGDCIFVVLESVFMELEDGATYAIYCWQGVNEIFSLERL